jgi:hypothetical protein
MVDCDLWEFLPSFSAYPPNIFLIFRSLQRVCSLLCGVASGLIVFCVFMHIYEHQNGNMAYYISANEKEANGENPRRTRVQAF